MIRRIWVDNENGTWTLLKLTTRRRARRSTASTSAMSCGYSTPRTEKEELETITEKEYFKRKLNGEIV